MSNGDQEEFVLRSGPRFGLKREFAFALRSHSEASVSLSRTRSRKASNPPSPIRFSSHLSSKRIKIDAAAAAEESPKKSNSEEIPLGTEGSGIEIELKKKSNSEEILTNIEGHGIEPKKCDAEEILDEKEVSGIETAIVIDEINGTGLDGHAERTPSLPPPVRRFTRSALKSNQKQVISTVAAVCGGSAISGDRADDKACKDEAISVRDTKRLARISPLKKKLEMKMSKKISLTKLPSTIDELLATRLLEGLPVKYVFRGSNEKNLQGIIKGDGILCSCSSCNAHKVVTALEFEQHAGSSRKNTVQHICFENGKTFRDILAACRNAPLDMLESIIQSTIGLSAIKKDAICQHCKEAFDSSRVGKSKLICNKCVDLVQSQEIQACEADASDGQQVLRQQRRHKRAAREMSRQCLSRPHLQLESTVSTLKLPARPYSSFSVKKHSLKPKSSSNNTEQQKNRGDRRLTKKDLRLHKLVFMEDVLPDGTEVAYYLHGQRLLEGYKKGNLIFCQCCNTEVSPSQFEAHAGWASRRKPYLNIYTSNGVSLHELSVSLSKGWKFSASDNDDLCTICADGGNLLLCDACPRAFHTDCLGLPSVPRGDWYCKYCKTMYDREKSVAYNANAIAAGRVSGVDPIEQISKRCIRIVKMSESEVTVCVLCRCHDFSKSRFGPRTVLLCDQCEKEYHVGCLKDHKMGDLKELPKGKWFCSQNCNRIHAVLEKLVLRGPEVLPESLLDVIKLKHEEKAIRHKTDLDIRWRLLSGKITSPDSRLLLSKAVAIFHDCFDPIVDSATGRDLIPSMVYGRNLRDQEFGGMYCAVLIVNSSVVSAGIIRIFGQEVAELPLVATTTENQGKGYFQTLFSCIERLLGFLNVKNILLPAADEAQSIWTKKFGLKKISQDQLGEYTKDSHMMIFQGTSMLHKLVPKCQIVGKPTNGSS